MPTTPNYGLPYQSLSDPPHGPDLGQNLAERVEDVLSDGTQSVSIGSLTVAGDAIAGSCAGINGFAVTIGNTDTTTSATYVNLAGTGSVTSFTFVKRLASTRVRVYMGASGYAQTAAGWAQFAVRINGVDYPVFNLPFAAAAQRAGGSGVLYISGLAAGSYTVQGRWRRSSGTGTMTRDGADWLSADCQETA